MELASRDSDLVWLMLIQMIPDSLPASPHPSLRTPKVNYCSVSSEFSIPYFAVCPIAASLFSIIGIPSQRSKPPWCIVKNFLLCTHILELQLTGNDYTLILRFIHKESRAGGRATRSTGEDIVLILHVLSLEGVSFSLVCLYRIARLLEERMGHVIQVNFEIECGRRA